MILLLAGITVLLSLPLSAARLILFQQIDAGLFVRGLLGVIWLASGFALHHQRRRLKLLRTDLIQQTDAATRHRVRGEQFYGLSILDPLTGLYNRRFGETRLQEEIGRADGGNAPLLLVALDFDRFKQINDKYGHAAGDLALKEFSRRLQRALRACDVPIRVGGDEFLVILPECPPDKLNMIFSRLGSIELNLDGNRIPVRFSMGMAQYQANDTPETMIQRADERLYAEKARRRANNGCDQASTTKSVAAKEDADVPSSSRGQTTMRRERVRRSTRIPREIAVFLIGSDLEGKAFLEQTNTVDLSQYGAGVVSRHKLAPEQEIIIRRQDMNKEVEARIVRAIGPQSDGYTYGLAFLSPDINLWGVECPPLTESDEQALHSLFECSRCEGRETVDDSGHKSDSFTVNKVVRTCKHCKSATNWQRVLSEGGQRECRADVFVSQS